MERAGVQSAANGLADSAERTTKTQSVLIVLMKESGEKVWKCSCFVLALCVNVLCWWEVGRCDFRSACQLQEPGLSVSGGQVEPGIRPVYWSLVRAEDSTMNRQGLDMHGSLRKQSSNIYFRTFSYGFERYRGGEGQSNRSVSRRRVLNNFRGASLRSVGGEG